MIFLNHYISSGTVNLAVSTPRFPYFSSKITMYNSKFCSFYIQLSILLLPNLIDFPITAFLQDHCRLGSASTYFQGSFALLLSMYNSKPYQYKVLKIWSLQSTGSAFPHQILIYQKLVVYVVDISLTFWFILILCKNSRSVCTRQLD